MHPNALRMLTDPQNKREQITGVIFYYLTPEEIDHNPMFAVCLERIALIMFRSDDASDCLGYRAFVVRNALNELAKNGQIDYTGPLYEMGA